MPSGQTLFIPDRVIIKLMDKHGNPLHQDRILLGIQTHANHRNDIDISPLVSDKSGIISITVAEITHIANEFIDDGVMDYYPLEDAKPNISIYLLGKRNINLFLGYEVQPELVEALKTSIPNFDLEQYKKQRQEQVKKDNNYISFKNSFNLSIDVLKDTTMVVDVWNKPQREVHYRVNIPI